MPNVGHKGENRAESSVVCRLVRFRCPEGGGREWCCRVITHGWKVTFWTGLWHPWGNEGTCYTDFCTRKEMLSDWQLCTNHFFVQCSGSNVNGLNLEKRGEQNWGRKEKRPLHPIPSASRPITPSHLSLQQCCSYLACSCTLKQIDPKGLIRTSP